MGRRSLPCLVLALLLAACGPLPRPFQPADKTLDLKALAGPPAVLLHPLGGDAPGQPREAVEQLAAALDRNRVLAITQGSATDYLLTGAAEIVPLEPGYEAVVVDWTLLALDGRTLGRYQQLSELPAGLWAAGQTGAVATVMTEAAPAIAALAREARAASHIAALADASDDGPGAGEAPGGGDWRVVVLPPEDAPGDGTRSLPQAMEAQLRAAKVPLAPVIGENDLIVMSDVVLEPAEDGWQQVHIAWFVVSAGDGADLGQIEQDNRIPAGSLDGPWGATAQAIAQGAAEGLVDLLKHLGRR